MTTINELFQGYDQYILWKPVRRETGKIDKIPCGMAGNELNAHDRANWMAAGDALARAQLCGLGVGFVFTETDPFFFIDIDQSFDNIALDWSPLAKTVTAQFPGCATETSYSGTGLHVFGTGRPQEPHRNRRDDLHLELYTSGRFVALTGVAMTGSSGTDGQAGLNWLVANYFRRDADPAGAEWTDEPCAEWNGPTDDDELIRRALRSRSASGTFGGKATFKQLWEADADVLSQCYPSISGQPFDHSAADAALASHLAFYTGRDCERMERLHSRSALGQRDKWVDRDKYRQDTILAACGLCKSVYNRPQPGDVPTPVEPGATIRAGTQYLDLTGQLQHFKGCAYVVSRHRMFTPRYGLLKPDQFKATYGGYQFAMVDGQKPDYNAFKVFTESQIYKFPEVDGTCFRPELEVGFIAEEEGLRLINTYRPAIINRAPGDPTPFLDLLGRLLPEERDRTILLSYMAACAQNPGVKLQWAPLVQGAEGNGKSFLMDATAKAVGERYTHYPNAFDLQGRGLVFTAWMDEKLLICIEEIFLNGKTEVQEALKDKITRSRIEMQAKGEGQAMRDNRANFFFSSNHKDAVRKTRADRRYCIFYSAQQNPGDIERDGMGGMYFPRLYEWARNGGWAIIAEYLHTYPIPDEYNPAGACHRAPYTSSTREALAVSLSPIEQEIQEAIEEDRPGFRGGFISSVALDGLLRETGRRVSHNKRAGILEQLGYFKRVRMNRPSPADGMKRPTLYVTGSGEDSLRYFNCTEIELTELYLAAQLGPVGTEV